MGRIVRSFFGGKPKAPAPAPAPAPVPAPVEDLEDEKDDVKKQRARLLKTEGGAAGQEVLEGGVSQRATLLGN